MPTNQIYKFKDINEAEYFLNGAVFGSEAPNKADGAPGWDVVGKTLIFTSPAVVTVTFTAGSGPGGRLLLKDLKTQIEAVATTVLVTSLNSRLILIEKTPTSGVGINKTGTANSVLGFDSQNNTVGKYYTPPGVTAGTQQWVWSYSNNENYHVVYTWE